MATAGPTAAADPVPSAAPAATTTSAIQQADDLFLKGKALLKEGKKQEALAAYRAAFNLRKSYDVAGNLGSLELDLGLHRDAAEHIAYALSHYAASGTTQDQLAKAKQRFETARKEVCVVHVAVSVEGAEVFVDGVSIGRAPIAEDVFVDAGARKIEARFPGYVTATKSVDAKKGGTEEVKLDLAPVPAPTATVTASATATVPPPSRSMVPAFVIGGGAIAGAIVGAGLLVSWGDKRGEAQRTANSILADGNSCVPGAGNFDARCAGVESTTRTSTSLKYAGTGTLVGAGVLMAGAGAYLFWAMSGAPAKSTIGVAPVVSKDGAALLLSGKW